MANKFKDIDSDLKFKTERDNQLNRDIQSLEDKMPHVLEKLNNQVEIEKRNKVRSFMRERQKQIAHDEKLIIERISQLFSSKKNYSGGLSR